MSCWLDWPYSLWLLWDSRAPGTTAVWQNRVWPQSRLITDHTPTVRQGQERRPRRGGTYFPCKCLQAAALCCNVESVRLHRNKPVCRIINVKWDLDRRTVDQHSWSYCFIVFLRYVPRTAWTAVWILSRLQFIPGFSCILLFLSGVLLFKYSPKNLPCI